MRTNLRSGASSAFKVGKAVWNGPFHVGRLERPVSTGDAILKIFETIWRFFVLLGVFFAVLGSLAGLSMAYQKALAPPDLKELLEGKARLSPKECSDPAYPVLITFKNKSAVVVGNINFDLVIRRRGQSTNLNLGSSSIDSDVIIPPRKASVQCWAIPDPAKAELPTELIFSTRISYATEYQP